MKSRLLTIAILAVVFCAAPTWAASHFSADRQGAVANSKTPKPSSYSVTLSIIEGTSGTSGPCTGGAGLANYCPSGNCDCYTYTGTASGTAGTGAVTFYETYYNDSELDEYDTYCASAYGDIEITGKKDVESIAFTGSDCGTIPPDDFAAPFLNGGCILASTNVFKTGGAVAQCGGPYSESYNTKFTIKGKALK